MANFPSLSRNPSAREFEETVAYDPTVRARSEGGYVKTRPRYTRFPKKWTVVYDLLSNTDKGTLQIKPLRKRGRWGRRISPGPIPKIPRSMM